MVGKNRDKDGKKDIKMVSHYVETKLIDYMKRAGYLLIIVNRKGMIKKNMMRERSGYMAADIFLHILTAEKF